MKLENLNKSFQANIQERRWR